MKYQIDIDRELTVIESTTVEMESDHPPTMEEIEAWLASHPGKVDYEQGECTGSTPWMIRQTIIL